MSKLTGDTTKIFFFKMFRKIRGTTFSLLVWPENDFKGVKKLKNYQKMRFPYISYIKRL